MQPNPCSADAWADWKRLPNRANPMWEEELHAGRSACLNGLESIVCKSVIAAYTKTGLVLSECITVEYGCLSRQNLMALICVCALIGLVRRRKNWFGIEP